MEALTNAQPVTLDDLPRHTQWVSYLLGLKNQTKPLDKNAESVAREFGQEKWGVLLQHLRLLANPSLADADRFCISDQHTPFYCDGRLYSAEATNVHDRHVELIRSELQPLVMKAGHLVELGSGYGSIILRLASMPGFESVGYTAGEFTDTGVSCMNLLAASAGIRLETGHCDLNDLKLEGFQIPENAVFMTSWAMAYVKGFSVDTLHEIIRHKPMVVVHFEPIYEHWNSESLLHKLWQRYCQINDYNQSLLSALKKFESDGLIRIIEEKPNLFGGNPLAPISMVKWIPKD